MKNLRKPCSTISLIIEGGSITYLDETFARVFPDEDFPTKVDLEGFGDKAGLDDLGQNFRWNHANKEEKSQTSTCICFKHDSITTMVNRTGKQY